MYVPKSSGAHMSIRKTGDADLNDILLVEREAFKSNREADFTRALLSDCSAKPMLSLMAFVEGQPAGHILFTKGRLETYSGVSVYFLAPLAVVPRFQKQGIGACLIQKGLELLSKSGAELVFVVGHPNYYPRFGFVPAQKLGFDPTYPIPKEDSDAWMVNALRPNVIGKVGGRVICCDTLNKPELWHK
jgi:putative acetyltransferase